jgi:hypothetical protein
MPGCSRGIFDHTPWSSKQPNSEKENCAARFASAQKLGRRGHRVALLGPVCSAPAEPVSDLIREKSETQT